ncbi:MAG: enoyl-CoA hydratase/isomerase family protein [Alphaproteobacteria bacterium]
MGGEFVKVERRGRVAVVTLDRGDGMNPLSLQTLEELTEVARSFAADLETTAIVLTGAGRGFSAGRDLRDPRMDERVRLPMIERRHLSGAGARLCRAWEDVEQFTIAAIEGFAIGGGLALALALDFRVMGRGAHFRAPEIALGLSMSWGSIPRLIRLVGPARAKQMLILAQDRVGADDARSWGLVQDVVPDGEALAHALAVAERVAAMPPVTVRMTKQTVNAVVDGGAAALVHMDTDQLMLTETTADFAEGVAAFKERRTPRFTGG